MGSIVSFMPRPAASARRQDRREEAASIIIFPGVRYERVGGKEPRRNGPIPNAGPRAEGAVAHPLLEAE